MRRHCSSQANSITHRFSRVYTILSGLNCLRPMQRSTNRNSCRLARHNRLLQRLCDRLSLMLTRTVSSNTFSKLGTYRLTDIITSLIFRTHEKNKKRPHHCPKNVRKGITIYTTRLGNIRTSVTVLYRSRVLRRPHRLSFNVASVICS